MSNDIQEQLLDPFSASDIEWRVQRAGLNGDTPWAMVIPYITARAVQERLDKVFGMMGWKNEFQQAPGGGVMCGISVKSEGEWITKYDGADNTDIEAVKGGLSNSMKRAAVQFGIGRYLYQLPVYMALCSTNKKEHEHYQQFKEKKSGKVVHGSWTPPPLPDFALPHEVLEMRLQTHIEQIKAAKSQEQLRGIYDRVHKWAADDVKSVDFAERLKAVANTKRNDLKVQQTKEVEK